MTIKDIFDTPINEIWDIVSPFVVGHLIFGVILFMAVLSFIIFVFRKVMKRHKQFDRDFAERRKAFDERWISMKRK